MNMAQAQIDLHANNADYEIVAEEEFPGARWSGESRDTHYMDAATKRQMEALLSNLVATGRCPEYRCRFFNQHSTRQIHHVESHNI